MRLQHILPAVFAVLMASMVNARGPATNKLLAALTSDIAAQSGAGAVLHVDGCGIMFDGAAGFADVDKELPMQASYPLRIGSVSKLATAATIHALIRKGVLSLDRPVSFYLPDGASEKLAGRNATLRQVLNHSAGIPDYYASLPKNWDWSVPLTPERILPVLDGVPATGSAGASYVYSNTGHQVLALVAERATGIPFDRLVEREFIRPLRLDATRYNLTAPGGPVHGYLSGEHGLVDQWASAENTGPDGGLTASAADVATMLRQLFLAGDRLPGIGAAMATDRIATGRARQWAGLGAEIRQTRDGLELVGHTGNVDGYQTVAYAIPSLNAVIVGHLNSDDTDDLGRLLQLAIPYIEERCAT